MLYKLAWTIRTLFLRLIIKRIGLVSYVGKPTFIYGGRGISIGNKVRIFPGLRAETHHGGSIIIDEDVSIGQNFHIISSGETLKIGSHTTISGNVFISNVDHDYQDIGLHVLQQKYLVKTTHVGENCFIGYGAVLQAGTIIGKQCVVGSNSVLRGTYPDYCVIAGAPAKIIKRYNPETKVWEKTDPKGNFTT
nr:acyltransferase [uncultured Mucilaginibacter sp.]